MVILSRFASIIASGPTSISNMSRLKIPKRGNRSAWNAWTTDKGSIPCALLIPLSVMFAFGWGIHSVKRNWNKDLRLNKSRRKSLNRGVELIPEPH